MTTQDKLLTGTASAVNATQLNKRCLTALQDAVSPSSVGQLWFLALLTEKGDRHNP